jgi:hypothetical protein
LPTPRQLGSACIISLLKEASGHVEAAPRRIARDSKPLMSGLAESVNDFDQI